MRMNVIIFCPNNLGGAFAYVSKNIQPGPLNFKIFFPYVLYTFLLIEIISTDIFSLMASMFVGSYIQNY